MSAKKVVPSKKLKMKALTLLEEQAKKIAKQEKERKMELFKKK